MTNNPVTSGKLKVTVNHLRYAGICVPGFRAYCLEKGFDPKPYILKGADEDMLKAHFGDDPYLNQVLRKAREYEARKGSR